MMMKSLVRCRRGATAIEYGLFAALAALILSSGISTIGEKIGGSFAKASGAMAEAATMPPSQQSTPSTTTDAHGAYLASQDNTVQFGPTRGNFLDEHRRP